MSRMTASERFDTKWMPEPMTGCHLWLCALTGGYGAFYDGSRDGSGHVRAHVYAYERKYGPVPKGLVLDHFVCDTPACCNPDHVRPTTSRRNSLRSDVAPAAINARKTHCKHGHEFTPENTLLRRRVGGGRHCRACLRAATRRWQAAARAGRTADREGDK